jgi:YbgC/YbaW family acyl-CoA thioester hydrolase
MPATFRTSRVVEFGDTDMAGIVHFTRFFSWMESAEQAFLRSLGLSVAMEWEGDKIGFPRVSAACDFLRPVRFEDVLDVVVTVQKIGRASVTYGFEFFKGDEAVASGRIAAVCCRVGPGRPLEALPIPDAIRSRLEPVA